MKRHGNLFEKACDFSALHAAFRKAFKGSGKTPEACLFCFNLEKELLELREELTEASYAPAPYRYFKVYDPKERVISVANFRDRVVHHAVVAVLEPIFESVFIFDSYATRKEKGTHKAVRRAQAFLKGSRFYLKLDIEKYFDNIDHAVLLDLIARKIKDERLLRLIDRIVDNSDLSRGIKEGKGLPIGNLTSQFFANVYLDALDHFVKDQLGIKRYVRYMDDMVFFGSDLQFLKDTKHKVEKYLDERIHLKLKAKATHLNTRLHGLPFLGYRVFPSLLRIRKENLSRVGKRLDAKVELFKKGLVSEDKMIMSVRSWFAFMDFADSRNLRCSSLVSRAGVG
jgi:RNA-directed DNA polymerase